MGYVREKYTKAYFLKHSEDGTPTAYGVEGIAEFMTGTIRPIDAKILESVDFRNARVIEFGFGRGEAAKYIIEHGAAHYEGIDFSAAAVEIAAGHLQHFNIPLPPLHNADALDFLRSYVLRHKSDHIAPFTVVSMLDFVEHVPREELREIFDLLKEIVAPRALFIVGTPAYFFDNEEDVNDEMSKVVMIDTSDKIEETKGMHCNKYTLISLQQFMKERGFSSVSQCHFFIADADSNDDGAPFRSYRQRWDAAVEAGVPLQKDWRQDFIEYAFEIPDPPRWQHFAHGDLKGCRLLMTDRYCQIFADGNYDHEMFEEVSGHEIEGKTVFDVGGFVGVTALLFAKRVGPAGRVCVFEPNPWNRDRMALNFSENPEPASVITGYSDALSDIDGVSEMIFSKKVDDGKSSTTRLTGSHPTLSDNTVLNMGFLKTHTRTLRLDTFVHKTGIVPDVIKVDIEGAEIRFLQGAEHTIKSYHPLLYVEIHSPYCAVWCSHILEQYGYRIAILREEEDGRLLIKAQAIDDFDETVKDSQRTDEAIRSVMSNQKNILRELEEFTRAEHRHICMSADLQNKMSESAELLKMLKMASNAHERMLSALTMTLKKIETMQQEFISRVYAAMSFKGMFVGACRLPFWFFRKIGKAGVYMLKHPIEAVTAVSRK